MPFGTEVRGDGSVRFRLWAPNAKRVALCEHETEHHWPLVALEDGWFELVTREVASGARYWFQIDDETKVPDPASRFQPFDVQGPSEVIDPGAYDWGDGGWRGRPREEAVIYELHVGAFSPEGTFRAAEDKLDYLVDLGITALELMPVADFPGRRNWGYDGVLPYAPDHSYGRPEDLKHLVEAAHSKGLMIFLDVVYNHFGPEGNYLRVFAPQFFTSRHQTPWGEGINFDGPDSRTVRDFFIDNALYWLEEYGFDGLRLDAVHAIVDDSSPDIVTELAQAVRQKFGSERFIHLILENVDNAAHYLRGDQQRGDQRKHAHLYDGHLYDAQWNDDIHHAMHVLITGESNGYYSDYARQPLRHLCRCLTEGFAYQGEYSEYHSAPRGEATTGLPPSAFVSFLQNHDQVGNRAFGDRISTLARPEALKAAMEILLLAPSPPLIFMGEEFGATTPFYFFCDFQGDLASAVTAGRRNEFASFEKFKSPSVRDQIPDPNVEETYLRSKLDWGSLELELHADWLRFYRQLLSLRRRVIFPNLKDIVGVRVGNCEERSRVIAIDWILANGSRLKLRANLGSEPQPTMNDPSDVFYCGNPEATNAAAHNRLLPWSVVWALGR